MHVYSSVLLDCEKNFNPFMPSTVLSSIATLYCFIISFLTKKINLSLSLRSYAYLFYYYQTMCIRLFQAADYSINMFQR